jgi:hypothetical protein
VTFRDTTVVDGIPPGEHSTYIERVINPPPTEPEMRMNPVPTRVLQIEETGDPCMVCEREGRYDGRPYATVSRWTCFQLPGGYIDACAEHAIGSLVDGVNAANVVADRAAGCM